MRKSCKTIHMIPFTFLKMWWKHCVDMLSRIHVLVQMCRPQGKPMLIHHALKSYYSSVSRSQLCLTLCDPMDCSPPGSSVHGIFQARILEWPVPSPGDLPNPGIEPRSPTSQVDSLLSEPPGKPKRCVRSGTHFWMDGPEMRCTGIPWKL